MYCSVVEGLVMFSTEVWLGVLYCGGVKSVYAWRQPEKNGISGETELSVLESRGGQISCFSKGWN